MVILQLKKARKVWYSGNSRWFSCPKRRPCGHKMVGREASKWWIKLCGATVSNKEICKLDTHEETHCPCGLHLHVHSFHLCSMLYGLRVKIASHKEYIRNLTDTCGWYISCQSCWVSFNHGTPLTLSAWNSAWNILNRFKPLRPYITYVHDTHNSITIASAICWAAA